jgi:hypothetical protein
MNGIQDEGSAPQLLRSRSKKRRPPSGPHGAAATRAAHLAAHGAVLESQRPQGVSGRISERRCAWSPRSAPSSKGIASDYLCTATQTHACSRNMRNGVERAVARTLNEIGSQQPAHQRKGLVEILKSSPWWPQSSKEKAPDRPATMGGEGT